jgi:CRISPR-associated protein Cmr4
MSERALLPERALLFLYAETPVHAGADTGSGALDLPIQREITTGLPIIKAESLKGALREHFRPPKLPKDQWDQWEAMFGSEPPSGGGDTKPGSLRVHEAQTLAFPVPTLERTFAWVTSPLAAARLTRKAALAGISTPATATRVADTECLDGGTAVGELVLGPYHLTLAHDAQVRTWAEQIAALALPTGDGHGYFSAKFGEDLLYGSDTLLAQLSRDCAPVVPRVQLGKPDAEGNRTKTVANGPFYSEYLPAETLMSALLEGPAEDLARLRTVLDNSTLRVGGDESIGKGLLWCRLTGGS